MIKKLSISGMTCHNCVRHTKEALEEIEGVSNVTVDLATNSASIECNNSVKDETLKEAVSEAGYEITAIN